MLRVLAPFFLMLQPLQLQSAEPRPSYLPPLDPPVIKKSGDAPVAPVVSPTEVTITPGMPVTAAVGKKCIVEIKTTAKKVTWRLPAGIDTLAIDGKRLAVWATPGSYTLVAQVPAGDDVLSTEITLTITGEIPSPVIDLFLKDLKAAYSADTSTTKAALVKKLSGLYLAAGTVTCKDESIKTWFDLFSDVSAANKGQMAATDIQGVRTVIQKRLDSVLPTDKKSAIDRALAEKELLNIATSLDSILK